MYRCNNVYFIYRINGEKSKTNASDGICYSAGRAKADKIKTFFLNNNVLYSPETGKRKANTNELCKQVFSFPLRKKTRTGMRLQIEMSKHQL